MTWVRYFDGKVWRVEQTSVEELLARYGSVTIDYVLDAPR